MTIEPPAPPPDAPSVEELSDDALADLSDEEQVALVFDTDNSPPGDVDQPVGDAWYDDDEIEESI